MKEPKKLYSVQYIKTTKVISDFEDGLIEIADGIYKLNADERKEIIDDLKGTEQSVKFLINTLCGLGRD